MFLKAIGLNDARLSSLRLQTWKLFTVPHNVMVFLLTTAILVQSRVWRLRED